MLLSVFQLYMWSLWRQIGLWQRHMMMIMAFDSCGASWCRDIFKCLILDWFRCLRGVVAILDLLFQIEFLDTLESWQLLLLYLDYLRRDYFVGGDQFLRIWKWLA